MLLTLIPPWIIGTDSSALTLQSIEHWMQGSPDRFEVLRIHWLWLPRLIAYVTGDAFAALVIFRAIIFGLTIFLFARVVERLNNGNRTSTIIAAAMLSLNIVVLYFAHTFAPQLLTLFVAVWLLYLFASDKTRNHRLAALIFGLSLSIGFWPFVLLLAVVTIGLNLHHTTYTPRSRKTYQLVGLVLIGAISYLLQEIFYHGATHVWDMILPTFYKPHEISLIAQGIIIGLFSVNVLLLLPFVKKSGLGVGLAREVQPAFVILAAFLLLNTFSREDMLHDAMVLAPCVILVALDRGRIQVTGPIYLVTNLGLFFLLPAFLPDPQIAMPSQRRNESSSGVSLHYYASNDLFSFGKVRGQANGENEVKELITTIRLDSTLVLITPGTDYWFDAATLGAMYPNAKFGWFYGSPINMVRVNGLIDTAFIRAPSDRPYLAGLFEKKYARMFIDSTLPPSVSIHESERFQLIDTRANPDGRKALIDQLIVLQYQSLHH
ncbi:MAG: hypothetical protein Q8921_08645 [Bacteroidota bacterium]|nr:hypothetical protein [Bacteroidota bacterium]